MAWGQGSNCGCSRVAKCPGGLESLQETFSARQRKNIFTTISKQHSDQHRAKQPGNPLGVNVTYSRSLSTTELQTFPAFTSDLQFSTSSSKIQFLNTTQSQNIVKKKENLKMHSVFKGTIQKKTNLNNFFHTPDVVNQ